MLGKDPDSLFHCNPPTSSTGINSSLNYSLQIFLSTKNKYIYHHLLLKVGSPSVHLTVTYYYLQQLKRYQL